jgi:hypothetical protein
MRASYDGIELTYTLPPLKLPKVRQQDSLGLSKTTPKHSSKGASGTWDTLNRSAVSNRIRPSTLSESGRDSWIEQSPKPKGARVAVEDKEKAEIWLTSYDSAYKAHCE